jgi:hypothetical protein
MDDLVPAFLVTVIGALLALFQASRFARWETTLLMTSFVAHIVAAFAQIWLTMGLYGGGDLFGYAWRGEAIAAVLRSDFVEFAPELLKVLFHQDGMLPVEVVGVGSTTGAMDAIAGFLSFFTGGSTYTLCLTVAIAAYFGKVALYRAFSESFPEVLHRRLMFAAMLVPSVVFWSSALLKESVAIFGMGYLVLGLVRLRTTPGVSLLQMGGGAVVIGVIKSYILLPMALASGSYFYFESLPIVRRSVRPVQLVLGAGIALGGVVLLSRIFPAYAFDNLAEQAATYQDVGQIVRGDSTYAIGDPSQVTMTGQLMFAPFALATSLFRPLLFESNSVQVAVNALETAVILFVTIRAFARRGFGRAWALIFRSPMLVLSLVFTVTFGIAVGLTTTNLGALSRYRMPLVPFFWALMLVVDARHNAFEAVGRVMQAKPKVQKRFPRGPLVTDADELLRRGD